MRPERRLIRGKGRGLASLRLEASDQPLPGLAHRLRLRRRRCLGRLDPPTQFGLGLSLAQALPGAGLADGAEHALDPADADPPLPMPGTAADAEVAGAVAAAAGHSGEITMQPGSFGSIGFPDPAPACADR